MDKIILLYGNDDLMFDRGALLLQDALCKRFPSYKVKRAHQPDEVLNYSDDFLIIVDVAKGISEPVYFTDPDMLTLRKTVTAHDMDLASFLKMLKAVGTLAEIPIVALPYDKDPFSFKENVFDLILSAEKERI